VAALGKCLLHCSLVCSQAHQHGVKAKRDTDRSKKREATGDRRRRHEGTERTRFVKQMLHRACLLERVRYLMSALT
jgi:hypothetical protein